MISISDQSQPVVTTNNSNTKTKMTVSDIINLVTYFLATQYDLEDPIMNSEFWLLDTLLPLVSCVGLIITGLGNPALSETFLDCAVSCLTRDVSDILEIYISVA